MSARGKQNASAGGGFPRSNEAAGAAVGSSAYQAIKKPAGGTGRFAVNAVPSKSQQRQVSKQGSPGRAREIFGRPARGLVKGYAK